MYLPKLKSVALPFPEIISIDVLGVANPQSSGTGGCRGSGMVPFERALVSSYRPSIVTFPLSYAFQRYGRFCAPSRHFSPNSPLVSSNFRHVTLGIGGWPLGYKERRCLANCP